MIQTKGSEKKMVYLCSSSAQENRKGGKLHSNIGELVSKVGAPNPCLKGCRTGEMGGLGQNSWQKGTGDGHQEEKERLGSKSKRQNKPANAPKRKKKTSGRGKKQGLTEGKHKNKKKKK